MGSCKNWIGDEFFDGDRQCETVTTKPMLAACLDEAFRMALADSMDPDTTDNRRRVEVYTNPNSLTADELAMIHWDAVSRNLACRFLGSGGWTVRGVYAGNASTREVFEATFPKPDLNPIDELLCDLRAGGIDLVDDADADGGR